MAQRKYWQMLAPLWGVRKGARPAVPAFQEAGGDASLVGQGGP